MGDLVAVVLLSFLVGNSLLSVAETAGVPGHDDRDEATAPLSRHKRLVPVSEDRRWPKGIMMYAYDVEDADRGFVMRETDATMKYYMRNTCLRFYPWVKGVTRLQHGLEDESHARFIVSKDGCEAVVSFVGSVTGQDISCCNRGACIHEIGHSLGFSHEVHNPLARGFVDGVSLTHRLQRYNPVDRLTFEYDMSSPMQGGEGSISMFRKENPAFAKDLAPLMSVDNHYAFFKEITFIYHCAERNCSDFRTKCDNDGYVGFVEDKCTCVCPVGLDPDTGCQTIRKLKTVSWPHGGALLLTPKEGCPGGTEVTTPLRHYNSTALESCQPFLLGAGVTSAHTDLAFCRSPGTSAPSSQKWPSGRYCLFRDGDTCPLDFGSEFIDFKFTSPPDGRNSRLELCCRDDGFAYNTYTEEQQAMRLPSLQPLVLLPTQGADSCPPVSDMVAQESCLTLSGNDTGLEVKANTTAKWSVAGKTLKLTYCHYTPISRKECGGVIQLTSSSPSATILSPNYPQLYDSPSHCFWFIKAPEGTNIILRFPELDLERDSEGICLDHLEIRYNVPGQKGIHFCGQKKESNIRSYNHTVMVKLHSNTAVGGKFKILADLVDPAKHCYNMADRGASYRGKVNVTRDFRGCLPWSQVATCDYSLFNQRATSAPLEGNYCRNPDNALRPWCYYYNREGACERYYCDVCQLEERYDTYPDCQELKTKGFCQRDSKEVMQGCAKTCQDVLALPTVEPPKTCTNPCAVEGGALVGAGQDSYRAGDVVTCRCQNGGLPINTTCLTDGSWSIPPTGYVCGACPFGWPRHQDHCYTYLYQRQRLVDTERTCAALGGMVATAKTQEETLLIRSIAEPFEDVWIGLNDTQVEKSFVWADGSPLDAGSARWAKGEPGQHRCVYLKGYPDYVWYTGRCDHNWDERTFVCKVPAGTRSLCADQRSDCEAELAARPSMCVDFPGFAAQDCARTCRVCLHSGDPCPNSHCPVPAPGSNVTFVTTAASIAQAQFIEYRCKDNMVLASGNLQRACLPCGKLSGSPPACLNANEYPIEMNKGNQLEFGQIGNFKTSYTGQNPSLSIPRDGEITRWRFFNDRPGTAVLQVWRPLPDQGPSAYKLVGRNVMEVKIVGREVEVDIPACDRIQVKAGDTLGVYYPWYRAGVQGSWDCNSTIYPQFSNTTQLVLDEVNMSQGKVYTFESKAVCVAFSLGATVEQPSVCQVPLPPNVVKVLDTDVITAGKSAVYRCGEGFSLLSGDLDRVCGACGKLSGVEPTCGDSTTTYEVNRVPLIKREGFAGAGWNQYSLTGNNPYFRVTRDGEITQWKFYSSQAGSANFQVWRPRPDLGPLQFEFVGKNSISSNVTGSVVTENVAACNRIQVKTGDVIGIYFPYDGVGVEWSKYKVEDQPDFAVAYYREDEATLTPGKVGVFTNYNSLIVSMRAVVGPVPTCTLTLVPANAFKVTAGDSVAVGQEAVYECQPGFQLLSGDLRRRCNACRNLNGETPTCGDSTTTYEVNRVPLIKREGFAGGGEYSYSLTGNTRHFRVTRDGEITQWKFYSSQAGSANFQVWRPRPDLGPLQFEFVGKNSITSNVIGSVVTENVAECDRIQVKSGDVIGIYFPWTKLGVEWSKCKVEDQPDFAVAQYLEHEDTLTPGKVAVFKNYGCLIVSMRAVVGPVPTCTLPPAPANAVKVTAGDSVAVGQEAVYECQPGFQLLSGDLRRRCNACRNLNGETPTCGDSTTTYEVNRVPLIKREGFAGGGEYSYSLTGNTRHFRVTRDGEITQWKFYSSQAGSANFQVWRPRPDLGPLQFEFVGKNSITSNVIGSVVTENVAECDRIQVKSGDVIGIYFPWTKLGVEWSKCKVEDQPDFAVAQYLEHEDTLTPGKVAVFKNYGCLIVSMRAVVGPVPTCTLPPAPANAVKVTAGDSVAVGQEAVYECQPGFQLLSGDLRRRCNACRNLNGETPTCGDSTTTYEVNRVPLIKREGFAGGGEYSYSLTGNTRHFRVTRDGEITQWKFFSSQAGSANFQVWRPRPDLGPLQFEFVGKNSITSNVIGSVVTENVAECNRIQVKSGDVIGIYFPWTKLGVEWSKCKVEEQPDFAVAQYLEDEATLTPGKVAVFKNYGCLIVSMRAVVGPVPTCTLLPVPANAVKVTAEDSVAVGQEAVYQCQPGFQLLTGDLRRRCNACRNLNGETPTCGDARTTYEVNRVPLIKRKGFAGRGWYQYSLTGNNPNFRMTRDGEITQWKFFSSEAGRSNFQVWRPRPDLGPLQFEFVGKNSISSNVTGSVVTENVAECDRIQVKTGDLIGIYFPYDGLGVEWSKYKVEEQPDFAVAYYLEDETTLTPGKVGVFTNYNSLIVSMRAVVGPVPTCTLPPVPANAVKVTAGDSVAVGQEVEYRCQIGYSLTSGNLKRKCLACDRKLDGIAPVCSLPV